MNEEAAPTAGWGKWSQPGVPHKGWTCVDISDLGPEDERAEVICEMCETTSIRYVHRMEHPDYPEALDCGCVCAGHMEGNLARARDRDRRMKNLAGRRSKFPHLKGWDRRPNGNLQIKVDGYRIVMFRKNGLWGGVVTKGYGHPSYFTPKKNADLDEAKLAAFDLLHKADL